MLSKFSLDAKVCKCKVNVVKSTSLNGRGNDIQGEKLYRSTHLAQSHPSNIFDDPPPSAPFTPLLPALKMFCPNRSCFWPDGKALQWHIGWMSSGSQRPQWLCLNGGGDDSGAWWEVNYQPEIPQNDLTSFQEVKFSGGSDRAPSESKVVGVGVGKCDGPWTKVKHCCKPGAFAEVCAWSGC
jgi:hypothetical protein